MLFVDLSNEQGDCIQNDHCVSRHCDIKTKKCLYCSSDASVATHHKCVKRKFSNFIIYVSREKLSIKSKKRFLKFT